MQIDHGTHEVFMDLNLVLENIKDRIFYPVTLFYALCVKLIQFSKKYKYLVLFI